MSHSFDEIAKILGSNLSRRQALGKLGRPVANAAAVGCQNGRCIILACNAGFANCDGAYINGCEVSTTSDVRNCGGCGVDCAFVGGGFNGCTSGACFDSGSG